MLDFIDPSILILDFTPEEIYSLALSVCGLSAWR